MMSLLDNNMIHGCGVVGDDTINVKNILIIFLCLVNVRRNHMLYELYSISNSNLSYDNFT